jgi:hypothetical protein
MEPFYLKKCNQWNDLNELIKEAISFNLKTAKKQAERFQ